MPKVQSAKKQADDAKALAKLLARIEENLKTRDSHEQRKPQNRDAAS